MNLKKDQKARLQFLARVVQRESNYLGKTTCRLFAEPFSLTRAEQLDSDDALAERVEAFVSRFARLQDNLGDKLSPHLLQALGERKATAIDNFDKAEQLGWIRDADEWLAVRQLRNQMVHEYIEDLEILTTAIQAAQQFVPVLQEVTSNLLKEMELRGWND